MVCDKLKSGHNLWPKLRKMWFVINRKSLPGGASNDQRGYQARPWTHKKHPKHVLLGLKFASLNKYSSGIWHPKQGFFFFKNPRVMMQWFTPKQVQFRGSFKYKILQKHHRTWQNYPKYVRFPKILPSYTNFCMKNNKYVKISKNHTLLDQFYMILIPYLRTYSAGFWKKTNFYVNIWTPSWHSSTPRESLPKWRRQFGICFVFWLLRQHFINEWRRRWNYTSVMYYFNNAAFL